MTPQEYIDHLRKRARFYAFHICKNEFPAFIDDNGYDARLAISPFTFQIVIESWIDDLEKYCLYHNIVPDEYKLAAFMMKWVSRLKPIPLSLGIHSDGYCQGPKLHRAEYAGINEIFAMQLGFARLKIDYRQVCATYPKIVSELFYHLYYRGPDPKHLYITLELLDYLVTGKRPGP
jgi:hypothetical protein